MSKDDRYYTVPLSILRSGQSALDVVSACIECGIVNAGIGYKKTNDSDAFDELLSDAAKCAQKAGQPSEPPKKCNLQHANGARMLESEAAELWTCALAGWKLLGVSGGNRLSDVQTWLRHQRAGEVFFRIKSDWLWGAVCTARRERGETRRMTSNPFHGVSSASSLPSSVRR